MKLSRLYSNKSDVFSSISFRPGINVIRADIQKPDSSNIDIHNLGKSTVIEIIDFCLLKGVGARHFFKSREDLFGDFVFFLELQTQSGEFVTIRRAVSEPSKASFKLASTGGDDFSASPDAEWNHWRTPFERSKTILDGYLEFDTYKPWDYRKGIGYQLRTQPDYRDVFQLENFSRGQHKHWKPFLSKILGFDATIVESQYEVEEQINRIRADIEDASSEAGASTLDINAIEGLIQLKEEELNKLDKAIDDFDFRIPDMQQTTELVDKVDTEIASLNEQRYSLLTMIQQIDESLQAEQIYFSTDRAEDLFKEAGVVFAGQIRKSFDQLIKFNLEIGEERSRYLQEEKRELERLESEVAEQLDELGRQRSEALAFLSSTDAISKYRELNRMASKQRAVLESFETRRSAASRLRSLTDRLSELELQEVEIAKDLRANVAYETSSDASGIFSYVRRSFRDIVSTVTGRIALLNVPINSQHHIDFEAYLLDDQNRPTMEQNGFTYRKFLCIAFDLAMIEAHRGHGYPQFVVHDGVFDAVETRKKRQLMRVMREFESQGFQHVITMLSSDDPEGLVKDEEVILILHDGGEEGRLFKMESW
jgi:uncharacterized protein YydD (DUF2326 family)